jgi:hypothetical protein
MCTVTCAKGIGNGWPLAAVVTTPEIAKTLTQRIHFNTFGGKITFIPPHLHLPSIAKDHRLINLFVWELKALFIRASIKCAKSISKILTFDPK